MAFTIQGFGTTFVGQRDFAADGSYITTEWVVFFFVPIVPLRSFRVTKTTRSGGMNAVVYSRQNYQARKLPLQLKQVFSVYGFMASFFGLFALLVIVGLLAQRLGVVLPAYVVKIAIFPILATPVLVAWYLRSRAKKRIAPTGT